jgi:hypothetical protein
MKLPTLNARDRRAALLALAVLVPSLSWIYVARPMRASLAETNDRIVSEHETFAREQAAILGARLGPDRRRVGDSAVVAVGARVFAGPNDVAAGATLVTYLGDVARRSHVWLASASTRAASVGIARSAAAPATAAVADGLRPLRVELRAESDFQGVLDFLDALERGDKIVVVERLDIAKTLRAGQDDRETLSVSATVIGYALPAAVAIMPAPAAIGRGAAPVAASSGKRGS